MLGRFDAGRHQAAGAGFEVRRGIGVVRHRHPHEAVHAVGPARAGGQDDLLVGDAGMLLVDPEAVIAADHAVDVEHGGMNEAADAEDAAELALGEAVFEAVHEGFGKGPGGF